MLTTVQDLLKVKGDAVWHVSPDATVLDALNLMAEKDIGALLVLEEEEIAGIVSERDFVRMIAQKQTCELQSTVKDYMTSTVFTIHPSQTIEDCMEMMTEKHIRHLPVTDGDDILGLISIGDVIKGIISSHEFTIEQLSKYIDGGGYNQ